LLVFHASRGELKKIPKCIFSLTNKIPTYLSKKPKPIKWDQQKNNQLNVVMWKKIISKSLKKIKQLFIPFQYN
jgi:hypothetical protein